VLTGAKAKVFIVLLFIVIVFFVAFLLVVLNEVELKLELELD